jgi:hypothetical protein
MEDSVPGAGGTPTALRTCTDFRRAIRNIKKNF